MERKHGGDRRARIRERSAAASQSLDIKYRYGRDFRPNGEPYVVNPRRPITAIWYGAKNLSPTEIFQRTGLLPMTGELKPAIDACKVTYVGEFKYFSDLDPEKDGELIRNAYPPVID